jgi:hypothetical protein
VLGIGKNTVTSGAQIKRVKQFYYWPGQAIRLPGGRCSQISR